MLHYGSFARALFNFEVFMQLKTALVLIPSLFCMQVLAQSSGTLEFQMTKVTETALQGQQSHDSLSGLETYQPAAPSPAANSWDEGVSVVQESLQEPQSQFVMQISGSNGAGTHQAGQGADDPIGAAGYSSLNGMVKVPLDFTENVNIDDAIFEAFLRAVSYRTLGSAVDADYKAAAFAFAGLEDGGLSALFDLGRIDDFITSLGLSSFAGLENPILVWMVNYTEDVTSLIFGGNITPFARDLMSRAEALNYRLMLPLLDLDDIQKVNADTVLMHNDNDIALATRRYGSDYFLTMAVSEIDGIGTVKWNLYTANAHHLAGSDVSGFIDELSSLTAGDIARTIASLGSGIVNKVPDEEDQNSSLQQFMNVFALGPGDGFVRIRIDNVASLADLKSISDNLITYGYDDACAVQGVDGDSIIVMIPTSSDPLILDGTMARVSDFTKREAWHYSLNHSKALSSSYKGIGRDSILGPDSRVVIRTDNLIEDKSDHPGFSTSSPALNAADDPALPGS